MKAATSFVLRTAVRLI